MKKNVLLMLSVWMISPLYAMQKDIVVGGVHPAGKKLVKLHSRKNQKKEKKDKDAGKKKLASLLVNRGKKTKDGDVLFLRIKNETERSLHRMKDWRNALTMTDQAMVDATNCYDSAEFVSDLLNPGQINGISVLPARTNAAEYSGAFFSNFNALKVKNNAHNRVAYQHEVADKLFALSDSQYSFFYVTLGFLVKKKKCKPKFEELHAFVIEKSESASKDKYRIYQSYYNAFSLAQWIGIDKWPSKWTYHSPQLEGNAQRFDAQYAACGNGKKIDGQKLYAFIADYMKYVKDYCDEHESPYFYCKIVHQQ